MLNDGVRKKPALWQPAAVFSCTVVELADTGRPGLASCLMSWCCSVQLVTASRKDGSQVVFVKLPFHRRLVVLWRRITVSVSRIKAVSPFYATAARDSVCGTVGGGFVASVCTLSRARLKITPDTRSCSVLFHHLCICQAAAESARLRFFVGSSCTSLSGHNYSTCSAWSLSLEEPKI